MTATRRRLSLLAIFTTWLPVVLLAMWLDARRILDHPPGWFAADYERDQSFQFLMFWVRYGWAAVLWLVAMLLVQAALLRRAVVEGEGVVRRTS